MYVPNLKRIALFVQNLLGVQTVRSPSLCLLAIPPRFFQIEIEVYLYTTLIASHPYYPMSVC